MQTQQFLAIPKLTKDNFNLWLDAVRVAATANGVQDHIISDPAAPVDAEAATTFSSKRAIAQCIIMSSIPAALLPELGHDIYSKSPYSICLHIKSTFDASTPIDHALLSESARAITLNDQTTIEDYIDRHTKMRARMVSAGYPNIENEITTVMFMIEGLRENPAYITVGEQMITNPPATIRDFSRTLIRLQNFRRISTPTSTIPPAFHSGKPASAPRPAFTSPQTPLHQPHPSWSRYRYSRAIPYHSRYPQPSRQMSSPQDRTVIPPKLRGVTFMQHGDMMPPIAANCNITAQRQQLWQHSLAPTMHLFITNF